MKPKMLTAQPQLPVVSRRAHTGCSVLNGLIQCLDSPSELQRGSAGTERDTVLRVAASSWVRWLVISGGLPANIRRAADKMLSREGGYSWMTTVHPEKN